jgi:cyclic dehypoxanthinyl futalosine synthase
MKKLIVLFPMHYLCTEAPAQQKRFLFAEIKSDILSDKMDLNQLYDKASGLLPLSAEEALYIYRNAPLEELMFIAGNIRKIHNPGNKVGWMIDRNVNITNVCFSQCTFCNFCRKKGAADAYVTTIEEYIQKIDELYSLGGDQLLLQGGMNPALGLNFYTDLFSNLKRLYPTLKLHALGPPEIVYLAKKEKLSHADVLRILNQSGLDSLPGAGAEILSDRVRNIVSSAKATSDEWLDVMKEAHILNLPTSATMMFGHIETIEERIEHLIKLRNLQSIKPANHYGFITFVPWPFQDEGTVLLDRQGVKSSYTAPDYLRMISLSRLVLNNIRNIQASILTVGKDIGMLSLHAGANDLGSIMIEENVVSAAGSSNRFNAKEMQSIIMEAGFVPVRRNQKYEPQ